MSADIHTSRTVPLTAKRFAYSLYAILFLCVSMFLVVLPAVYLYFLIGPVTEKNDGGCTGSSAAPRASSCDACPGPGSC